jgi:hypothetical protein
MMMNYDGSKVRLVGFYPTPETNTWNKTLTDAHYAALVFTYRAHCQMVTVPSEIFLPPNYTVVSVEENEGQDIETFQHPERALYVTGNSQFQWPSEHIRVDEKVSIKVPDPDHPLYGSQALAIVLHDRFKKHGNDLHTG